MFSQEGSETQSLDSQGLCLRCVCVSASQKAPSGREDCECVCVWHVEGGCVNEKPAKEVTGDEGIAPP